MTDHVHTPQPSREYLQHLDNLIKLAHDEIVASLTGKIKLRDYLRMIETRHRLDPSTPANAEFWKMIESIKADAQRPPRKPKRSRS